MKTKFLLFLLIIVANYPAINAQDYKPLLVEGNQWNVVRTWPSFDKDAPLSYKIFRTSIYKLDGDTIVGDIKYKKLINCTDKDQNQCRYIGLIREDLKEQKVFYKPDQEEEYLLYDFGAQVGDVVFESDTINKSIVRSIDYVNIGGVERKVITIESDFLERLWIEGIGGDDGLLSRPEIVMESWLSDLLCFSQNNQLVYKLENPDFDDYGCYAHKDYSGIEEEEIDNLSYTISVVDNTLSITSIKAEPFDVKIYNMLGSQILTKTGNVQNVKISTEGFSVGNYVLSIVSDGVSFRRKVVI